MDIFDEKAIKPMLISEMKDPFNSLDYIYELKLDGLRCISYLDPSSTELRNKRDMKLLPKFPELSEIHKNCKVKCILDGELIVLTNGSPDFYELQRRTMLTDPFKIRLAISKFPASFVAYDIIYYEDRVVNDLPLMERKSLLANVFTETNQLSISRYIEEKGIELFQLAKQQNLEGIVAKRKDSKYWFGKNTKDWIKCKIMQDDDFVICGYILKQNNMTSLVIGQYSGTELIYKGHVTLGASLNVLNRYRYTIIPSSPFIDTPKGNEEAVWLKPELVCIVESMPNDRDSMRQPVLKGIREDKHAMECQVKE